LGKENIWASSGCRDMENKNGATMYIPWGKKLISPELPSINPENPK
jgi:hypothetical protein